MKSFMSALSILLWSVLTPGEGLAQTPYDLGAASEFALSADARMVLKVGVDRKKLVLHDLVMKSERELVVQLGRTEIISGLQISRDLHAVWRREHSLSPAASALLEEVTNALTASKGNIKTF